MYVISAQINKRILRMAYVKFAWLLADILGISSTLLGIISKLDPIKSTIAFVVGITYLIIRVYYYNKQKSQSVRDKEMELWHKQMDKLERQQKLIDKNKT